MIFALDCNLNKQWMCLKSCVTRWERCNQVVDCPESDDEISCSIAKVTNSSAKLEIGDKLCRVTYDSRHAFGRTNIYEKLLSCETTICDKNEYKCFLYGYCITVNLICDGVNHCPYGDDEMNCNEKRKEGFFKCRRENIFIENEKICNDNVNCMEGSDEIFL